MKNIFQKIKYTPSKTAMNVLIKGNIIAPGEAPQKMFERVVNTIFGIEASMGINASETEKIKKLFAQYMSKKLFTPGTPTLTNAGRDGYEKSALSSCAIIPTDLRNKVKSKKIIKAYYRQNMGSGFDLSPYKNPIELLLWLNNLSVSETKNGQYDRYIGNMANLHISHPSIRGFIDLKRNHLLPHFNCSIVVNDNFMNAVIKKETYQLADGQIVKAQNLLYKISESAWSIGDPSIINLDRMNKDNPIKKILPYISAPPCAEMGLSNGETCQFIYIDISKFCTVKGINYKLLKSVVRIIVRALDNSVEYGINRYPSEISSSVARLKRKIGIAVSGIADTLLYYKLPYSSIKARSLARDVVSYVNYISKCTSVELAEKRGSCEAMKFKEKNEYYYDYLSKRYNFSTHTVSKKEWRRLNDKIKKTGLLRNILTITQPPAARVSLLMDCSFGIEPIFGFPTEINQFPKSIVTFIKKNYKGNIKNVLQKVRKEGTFKNTKLSSSAKECLKTATELSPISHIEMVVALAGSNGVIDETASKTVNLPKTASIEAVYEIFLLAHSMGLKNISIYRDGSYLNQPYKLSR
ncbi:MAG: Ribonucleoside-diphosphate reductase [Candidatus Roizmanbacteria bacterium GW2011_GWA2_32_13]|uniref:Ribonucleoside-diphosphate reductase n=1 Tax=Candidatus Roizmanbacteria bacterium GW2011_GWA2_32_13 TaxID=1618475 RepID=A0A0G0C056_9BACT|nr:MAG: Ribonucleoside-diphosphate reductase [Candidatus Roizmanbacteria bacterium GW2011_GWA2_32_13]